MYLAKTMVVWAKHLAIRAPLHFFRQSEIGFADLKSCVRIASSWLQEKAVWNRENPKDPILRHEKGKFKPKEQWVWIDNAHPAILNPKKPKPPYTPPSLRLTIAQHETKDFTVPVFIDASRNHGALRTYPTVLSNLDNERIHQQEWILSLAQ